MKTQLKFILAALVAIALGGGYVATADTLFKTDAIISHSGGPVSLPGGVTLASSALGDLHASTYAATATAGTNVDSLTATPTLQYVSIGNAVAVWGQLSVNTTTDNTAGAYTLSLPFTRSANFSTTGAEGSGVNGSNSFETGACQSTNAAKTITCNYYADGTGTQTVQVMFLYDKT
jgi:hypothetical protein